MSRTFSRDTPLGQRMDLLGYTVREVAEGTGISRFDLNDYMRHGRKISPMHLMRLSAFLKCEPELLAGR